MFTNGLNMGSLLLAWVEKTVCGVDTHTESMVKKTFLGVEVSKEGDADSLVGHEKNHHYWFSWKRCNCDQCFLLSNPKVKFTLVEWPSYIIWHTHIHIYIYIDR